MGDLSDLPDLRERCFILDGLITFSLVIGDEDAILLESERSCSIEEVLLIFGQRCLTIGEGSGSVVSWVHIV